MFFAHFIFPLYIFKVTRLLRVYRESYRELITLLCYHSLFDFETNYLIPLTTRQKNIRIVGMNYHLSQKEKLALTNSKKNSQLQFALRVAITLLIWLLFANVPLKTFFEDSSQIQLILISIPFAILLNQVAAPNKNTLVTVICDSLVGLLSIHLFLHAGYLNTALLLIDFIFANILLLTPLVNEPHGRWIIFGIINGSGMAFLFNISYHHYFSLISLMYITTLIFSNIFFSYHGFMTKQNLSSLLIILILIVMLCLTLQLSFLRMILLTTILGFYLFFESQVNPKNFNKRANVSAGCYFLFSLLVCL
ncbi:hypothetical protein FC98_GL000315 [Lentilactobacillus kisonensis DSM 19906 = JCM 15041]|uniref:Uncharacterized protein n=1 Tax=Lentilactobacillus kisonensis DSM 19906 = JCM 15041 TaxID=1423766 RepID=A0A0R1P100_9LACO|nr:hypothetical protein FC98_GL000315 [Lentilactobacillus kisonensis DSM 19906 = JCM 15041]